MFRSIAILVLVVLSATVSTARLPAAPLTSMERQHLVAHLEMTAAWLADEVTGLTAAQIAFQPDTGAWSIAQVVDHLLVVAPIYWRDLQAALEQPAGARTSGMSDADVLWYGIDRTRREQAIPGERTTGELRDMPAALAAYRKHDDLRGHLVQRQACDAYQWALLISTHEQRHVLQIREIKANPRFPKK
jgi:hypothetical protein